MILTLIALFLGLYILLEAIDDVGRYSGPDRFCLVLRDAATGVAGVMLTCISGYELFQSMMHRGWQWHIDALHLALAIPLALYLWPKMVHRFGLPLKQFRRG